MRNPIVEQNIQTHEYLRINYLFITNFRQIFALWVIEILCARKTRFKKPIRCIRYAFLILLYWKQNCNNENKVLDNIDKLYKTLPYIVQCVVIDFYRKSRWPGSFFLFWMRLMVFFNIVLQNNNVLPTSEIKD